MGSELLEGLIGTGNIVPMSCVVAGEIHLLTTLTQDVKAKFVREGLQRIPR